MTPEQNTDKGAQKLNSVGRRTYRSSIMRTSRRLGQGLHRTDTGSYNQYWAVKAEKR